MTETSIIGSILLGVLPSIAWLTFFLHEDKDSEPWKYIALTFILGIAFAFIVLFIEIFLADIFPILGNPVSPSMNGSFSPPSLLLTFLALAILACAEEIGKFFAAYIAVRNNPDFDIPVDAMIYIVTAALGFALVENLGVVGGITTQSASLIAVFGTISFRFVGATLLHALSSSIVGYYWAKSIRAFGDKSFLAIGIMIATALHAAFNFLILSYGPGLYPVVLILFMGFYVLSDFEELREEKV